MLHFGNFFSYCLYTFVYFWSPKRPNHKLFTEKGSIDSLKTFKVGIIMDILTKNNDRTFFLFFLQNSEDPSKIVVVGGNFLWDSDDDPVNGSEVNNFLIPQ